MSQLLTTLLTAIMTNPLALGAVITTVITWIHSFLVTFDKSGVEQKYSVQLHILFLVLTFLATAADAASKGQLGNVDLTSLSTFLTYWLQVLVGGKAMSLSHGLEWRKTLLGK